MAGDTPEANRPSLGSFLLGKLDLESSALVRSLAASASASTFLGRSVGEASMARSVGEASMARPVGEKLVETQSIMSFHPPNLNISYSVAPDLDLGLFVASDAEEHDDRFTSDESSSIASSEEEDSQLVDANGLQSIDGFEVVAQTVPATPEVENPAAMGIARPRSSLRPDAQPFQITEDLFNAEMTVNGDAGIIQEHSTLSSHTQSLTTNPQRNSLPAFALPFTLRSSSLHLGQPLFYTTESFENLDLMGDTSSNRMMVDEDHGGVLIPSSGPSGLHASSHAPRPIGNESNVTSANSHRNVNRNTARSGRAVRDPAGFIIRDSEDEVARRDAALVYINGLHVAAQATSRASAHSTMAQDLSTPSTQTHPAEANSVHKRAANTNVGEGDGNHQEDSVADKAIVKNTLQFKYAELEQTVRQLREDLVVSQKNCEAIIKEITTSHHQAIKEMTAKHEAAIKEITADIVKKVTANYRGAIKGISAGVITAHNKINRLEKHVANALAKTVVDATNATNALASEMQDAKADLLKVNIDLENLAKGT